MIALSNFLIKILFVFLAVFAAVMNTDLNAFKKFTFWISIDVLFLIITAMLIPIYKEKKGDRYLWPLKLFLVWVIIGFFRGAVAADNYWDWKNLVLYSLTMLLPAVAFLGTNKVFVQKIVGFWLKYGVWLIFLFIPFIVMNDAYGSFLAPIMLLIIILPLLPRKWKWITLFFAFMVLSAGFDSRSNLIRFAMAFMLAGVYYFPLINKVRVLKMLHMSFFVVPLLLLTLGISGSFNIFKMDEYMGGEHSVAREGGKKEKLTADTRTFIYVETISSAINNDYVLQGRTPAKGYDSPWFGAYAKYVLGTGRMIRYASEVSICNVFTWYGIIGVVLYSIVFFIATFLAVYRSNNYFIKVIGVFVAFRWAYSFIEEFNRMDIQMAMLWLMIGMCFSSYFRAIDNNEFKQFARRMVPKIRV